MGKYNAQPRVGEFLHWLVSAVRRSSWLVTLYRCVPMTLRAQVSRRLEQRRRTFFAFPRGAGWKRHNPDLKQSTVSKVRSGDEVRADASGVNIICYAYGQFGLAESARLYSSALIAANWPIAIRDAGIGLPHELNDKSLAPYIKDTSPYPVNLIFVNPDHFVEATANLGPQTLEGRYNIACWFWELERFPEAWLPALTHVDEIIVASEFVAKAVRAVTDKPVTVIPIPLGNLPDSGLIRADFGITDNFTFLVTFDFNSSLARKNPIGTMDAFRRAFPEQDVGVRLLIKSSNGHRYPDDLKKLLEAAAGDKRICVRDEVLERSDLNALLRCADAYVSLHRSEGFGLGLAEAMWLGKPVIATAWSGNVEFMTSGNSCLVDYQLVPVCEGEYLHHKGQRWAEPSVAHAADLMRRVVEDGDFAERIGAQAAQDIRERLSLHVAAQRINFRLEAFSSHSGVAVKSGVISVIGAT